MNGHPAIGVLTVLGLGALLAGCLTSRVEELKNTATGIDAGESIVILSASYHKGKAVEEDFVGCVREQLTRGDSGLAVYPEQQFADDLFPWFEPRTAPQSPTDLPELLAKPGVAERVSGKGIRYLVWLNGGTEQTGGGGSMSCAIGIGVAGCIGFGWWENESKYDAAVWDLRNATDAGTVRANVNGTSMVPALIIPIPLIARVKTAACEDIAGQLAAFIRGSAPDG
ncbi:MAG: hypothetical protein FJ197_08855 [Gammaproteobacteria bacterium]|nr:hypothetical protein [Gammaproteobacteria bacterium]